MKVRVEQWGESLAIRIPAPFSEEAHLRDGMSVELQLTRGRFTIAPASEFTPTLEELIAGITDENRHGEWGTGADAGRERW